MDFWDIELCGNNRTLLGMARSKNPKEDVEGAGRSKNVKSAATPWYLL